MAGIDKNTLLILHGEDLTDSSLAPITINNSGVKTSSEVSKFEGSSLRFDGSSSLYVIDSQFIFRSGDFTIDWWEYRENNGTLADVNVFDDNDNSNFLIAHMDGDSLYGSSANKSWDMFSRLKVMSPKKNVWSHKALVRKGNRFSVYVDGKNTYNGSFSFVLSSGTGKIIIGRHAPDSNPDYFMGYVDEFRVSNVARWDSDFAPPDAPYSVDYPHPPENLNLSSNEKTVTISWTSGLHAETYNVYRNNRLITTTSELMYVDLVDSYGEYTYSVKSVNQYGESDLISRSISVSPPQPDAVFKEISTYVYLLDSKYDAYDVIDKFKSLLWTVRFTKVGEFELYVPADLDVIKRFHEGDYVWIEDSDRLMIIEDINLQTDVEDGDYLIISGRSLESILERRIIWGMTVITGNFQNGIRTLLERNVISPASEKRKIPNFTFKESTDPRITELTVEAQYFGENLYEEIEKLCEEKKVGFRVLPKGSGGFEFSLYVGEDRSYNQIKNPWVVFSPNYENLQASNYLYSKKNLRNATLVGGQGENWNRDTIEVTTDSSAGLNRRETFTDASGVTNDTTGIESDDTLAEEEKQEIIQALNDQYLEQLQQKGQEELAKTSITETFDGEIDASLQYVYGKDFNLGDIVQIGNAYGMEASTRVSEIVISHDSTGKTIVPTFTVKSDEEGDE